MNITKKIVSLLLVLTMVISLFSSISIFHGTRVVAQGTATESQVFVAMSGSGNVEAYNSTTGAFIRTVTTGISVPNGLCYGTDGYLYVTSGGVGNTGYLYKVDIITGNKSIVFTENTGRLTGVTISEDKLYVAAADLGHINVLSLTNYQEITSITVPTLVMEIEAINNQLYVSQYNNPLGAVYVFSTVTNQLVQTISTQLPTSGIAFDVDQLCISLYGYPCMFIYNGSGLDYYIQPYTGVDDSSLYIEIGAKIYSSSYYPNCVKIFNKSTKALEYTITQNVSYPSGIAVVYPLNFYVDNTNGNDNNNGLTTSTPWKTLSKVSTTTFYNGDTINLKCGEVWNESLTLNGQGTGESPITVQSYGTGNKPKLRSNAYCVVSGTNVGGWTVKGLTVECTTTATMPSGAENNGIQFNYTQGGYSDINIIGNEVYGAGVDKSINGIRILSVFNGDYQGNVLNNINITDNNIHDVGWVGITNAIWNTVLQQDMRSINSYSNVNILRNTVYNTGCQGIPLRCTTNGNMKWNLVYNCGQFSGTGLGWGAVGIWCILSSNIDIMFNEVYGQGDSNNGYDAGGFDIDWTCDNIDLWYNYAHDNEGPGIETMSNNYCTIKYNKVSNNNCLTSIGTGQISLSAYAGSPELMTGVNNLSVTNNLIFVNKANTVALSTNLISAGTWSNNTFSYNNIVYSNALTGVKVYNLTTDANITAANYNNIYSSNGTAFKGTKNGITYTTLSAWRTGTGFDLNSVTARSETGVPTSLKNLNGSQGTGLVVNLTWSASTDSGRGISHYNVYRSTSSTFTPAYTNMVGESTTTSFSDTSGLASGVTYYYKVTAEDKCGNVGTAGSKTVIVS